MLAWGALFAITIGLLIKRRWLEVASLMIGAGLVPTVGYLIVGPPDLRPSIRIRSSGRILGAADRRIPPRRRRDRLHRRGHLGHHERPHA